MPPDFGCENCFRGDAARVWEGRAFNHLAQLIDDSHFSINILACRACGQHCVKIFTEFIDWSGGDDAQYWSLVPLTPEQADLLIAQGDKVSIKEIEAMSHGRPYLQVDYPTGKDKRIRWSQGPLWIVPGH